MKTEKILVANLKCSGCANTITKKISEIKGVAKVDVDPEEDSVTVTYDEGTPKTEITSKLHSLGYPEATEENGLLLQLKSYASCMVGRINK
ncbi:MAG: heavy-metal-associated domain-containing protein [Bacteroidia bacterium]